MHSFFRTFPDISQRIISSVAFHVLGVKSEIEMILRNVEITHSQHHEISEKLMQIQLGKPLEYVLGKCEFLGMDFFVNKSVLIPRVDTESIVNFIYEICPKNADLKILDICTGSGCIGISLAKHFHNATVTMVDISTQALEICKQNAQYNGVDERVSILHADVMQEIPFAIDEIVNIDGGVGSNLGKSVKLWQNLYTDFNIIVSNPPYIRTDVIPTLDSSVYEHEPHLALDGGRDGLKFYRKIIKDCITFCRHSRDNNDAQNFTENCNKKTMCVLEIGYDQADDLRKIMHEHDIITFEIIKDLTGNDRGVFFKI